MFIWCYEQKKFYQFLKKTKIGLFYIYVQYFLHKGFFL